MKVLFFDLDGTLTDISRRMLDAVYDTASHFGLKVSKSKVRQLCNEMLSYFDVLRKLGLELTKDVNEYYVSAFLVRYQLSTLRRGTKSTLKALSREYKLFCVTSRESLAQVTLELIFLSLDGLFNCVVTREVAAKHFGLPSLPLLPFHEQRRKLYECALSIASCPPNEAVVIGDMASELKPAKELGITTIGLLTDKIKENELKETSDYLISSITHLRKIFLKSSSS